MKSFDGLVGRFGRFQSRRLLLRDTTRPPESVGTIIDPLYDERKKFSSTECIFSKYDSQVSIIALHPEIYAIPNKERTIFRPTLANAAGT